LKPRYQFGPPEPPEPPLDEFQKECVAVFQRAAVAFNLPPSVGQIYGLLFSTPEALSLDQIVERLGASRGGTFQSLRWLREIGAVQSRVKPGRRRQYFGAELNLRKLAGAFLNARIEPHVESGAVHLDRLRERLAAGESASAVFQRERYSQIERWHRFIADVLPFIKTFAEKF
jgi:DNA-binding transcriptional regulator GbsR (MarR family)